MGSNQLYSLTWGEFGTSLVSAVQLLRCHGDLVDVTLAAGGRSFPAHKIVLCAASPFLLSLLKSTPCKHPVVMLAGVTATDLEALLEFVYRGEVSVDPNQLPSLLQAAHCLNIQGLAPGTISTEKPDDLSTTLPSSHEALTRDVINSFLPIRRRKRTKRRNSTGSGSSSAGKWPRQEGDVENLSLENQHVGGTAMTDEHEVLMMSEMPSKTEPEQKSHSSDEQTSKKNSVSDQPATCPLCGATLRQSRNLRRHLELLHFGVGRSTVKVRTRKSSGPTQAASQSGSMSDPGTSQSAHAPTSSVHQTDMSSPPINMSTAHSQPQPLPMPHMSHMISPHCQNSSLPTHMRPRHEELCEPSPVLSCMLPPMPPPNDPVFRQHHADMLRGAGLYAETRTVSKVPGSSDMRQEVV